MLWGNQTSAFSSDKLKLRDEIILQQRKSVKKKNNPWKKKTKNKKLSIRKAQVSLVKKLFHVVWESSPNSKVLPISISFPQCTVPTQCT